MHAQTAATCNVLAFPLYRIRPSAVRAPIPSIDNSAAFAACEAQADRLILLRERACDFAAMASRNGDAYAAARALVQAERLEDEAVDLHCYARHLAEEHGQPVPTLLNWLQLTAQERQDATEDHNDYLYGDREDPSIWYDLIESGKAYMVGPAAIAAL